MNVTIPAIDLVIIILYLILMVVLGIYSSRKLRKTASGYFLAGKSLTWPVIGAALFASNISTIHLVGLAASGYAEGLAWGNYEWMAAFTLIVLGLVFAPFYFKTKIVTLPEYMEKRYSARSRAFLAFMGILAAIFMHIGLSLYSGAVVFRQFFGIDVFLSIVLISVVTGIYTILGGLKAVVVTETIQTFILIFGAVAVTVFAILALPDHGISSYAELVASVKDRQLSMIHTDDDMGLAWYSVVLGYPVLGIWYWCTDQTIVQRVLGARTQYDAKVGPIFAGFLKILPVLFIVFPGVLAYVLFSDIIGEDANQALPVLITQLIPTGMMGLISAGLLAALMSSIAAALHSISTLVSYDIVQKIKSDLNEKTLIRVGQISAVVVMLMAMIWSTQGQRFTSIFQAVATIGACLAPSVTTVFLWGVIWKRSTEQAAFITLIFGFLLGAFLFMAELPLFGDERLFSDIYNIGTLMQAWWSFVLCSIVFVVSSLLTPAPDEALISQYIVGGSKEEPVEKRRLIYRPAFLSFLLVAAMVVLYALFY